MKHFIKILSFFRHISFGLMPADYYSHGVAKIYDYLSIIISQFPIIVIRKIKYPYLNKSNGYMIISILGFTFLYINLKYN